MSVEPGGEVVWADLAREDAAHLLLRLHAIRAESSGLFGRQDNWLDRAISSLERGFEILGGPAIDFERRWVCPRCCAVNAIGTFFCGGELHGQDCPQVRVGGKC